MRYWFDTEFNEHDRLIDLISIGIIAEDGRQYYAENADLNEQGIRPWIANNVLIKRTGPAKTLAKIHTDLIEFSQPTPTEMWAWFGEPNLPPQSSYAHHALTDAIWCKKAWEELPM